MSRVAVVGAGLAGLACASALGDAGFGVTVFDKGRNVGGRTSTRREGEWSFDHGAPRLELGVPELAGPRTSWEDAGVVVPWRPRVDGAAAHGDRATWIGMPGSNALARHLATRLEVERNARVVGLSRRGGWWLEIERATTRTSRGPFETVVITAPTPQAITLLATTAADALRATLSAAAFAPCVVAMLAIETKGVTTPVIDELHVTSGPFASAHRLDLRPGRARSAGVELWVVHGSEAWSAARLEDAEQDVARELADALSRHVAGRVIHARGHRWRYARAASRIAAACAYDAALQLGVAGDGFAAGTSAPAASRALTSGRELAARIIASESTKRGTSP